MRTSTRAPLSIQPKLTVNQPGDKYEQEADRVAEQVMRMPEPAVQRKCACGGTCSKCKDKKAEEEPGAVQMKRAEGSALEHTEAPKSVHAALRGSGRPLDTGTRAFMEPRFGHDLSNVRIHTGGAASRSATDMRARAYTVGNKVVFGQGQYAPGTSEGRQLLAHELTHTIQQGHGLSTGSIQRLCDPAIMAARTTPVFFPVEPTLKAVFDGAQTLSASPTKKNAVGLVQQALVDMGATLGTTGPNGDGVDREFGSLTGTAITSFQTSEAIAGATPATVDQATLKCLDEKRARIAVPSHLAGSVSPADVQINDEQEKGRDEDIFFDRGSAVPDALDKKKLERLLTARKDPVTKANAALKGCALTLEGYISEDELVEFGTQLATDRIDAVEAELVIQGHNDPGPVCTAPVAPLRTKTPLPDASSRVPDYRQRRKVEVVPAGSTSTTAPCPPGAPTTQPFTAAESTTLTAAIDLGVQWLNTAIGELTPGDPEGNAALTTYFGGTTQRAAIKTSLNTWKSHLDTNVRVKNARGTACDPICRMAIAYNLGSGSSAMMTACPRTFEDLTLHPALSQPEKKAFVLLHEAGHGAISTRDAAYGHFRLIEFLASRPGIALTNTDSYALMVLCLNGFASLCTAPVAADHPKGMSPAQEVLSRKGLAWLETWLDWAEQDLSSLYKRLEKGRTTGVGVNTLNPYSAQVQTVLGKAFGLHRPANDPAPTFGEQTTVAAILDRLTKMFKASTAGLDVERDAASPTVASWDAGPGRRVQLNDAYFALTTDRTRVEFLLPLLIRATNDISVALEPNYATFIKETAKVNHGDKP